MQYVHPLLPREWNRCQHQGQQTMECASLCYQVSHRQLGYHQALTEAPTHHRYAYYSSHSLQWTVLILRIIFLCISMLDRGSSTMKCSLFLLLYPSNNTAIDNIVQKTFNINFQNNTGDTPLHMACFESPEQPVIVLLKHGANANIQNAKGETPLHIAARMGQAKILQTLLDLGSADVKLKGDKGSAFDVAAPIDAVKAILAQVHKLEVILRKSMPSTCRWHWFS